jgi:Ni/Fe-hydrogenase subunit HybB-like protein
MKTNREIEMWTPFTRTLVAIIALGGLVLIYRLIFGLGAATNLNDRFPWGLWIGMDVLGGEAMAAGGFIIAGAVYILNWKKYKPIVRPAVLTAFFGYLLAATAVFFDIGIPYHIWHPMVMWQVHSLMWFVSIYVMLYTMTLATESSPMIFEKLKMKGALRIVEKIMAPVVLFGVLLSVLHQSSLGAVYLITPAKMSPLWYSDQIPTLFLISAIMMGLSVVSFENIISSKAFGRKPHMEILSGLARGCLIAAVVYLALKIYVLATGPGIAAAFNGSMEANMYLLELMIGVAVPIVLLLIKGARENLNRIFTVNIMVISGILLNRMNVSLFGMYRYQSSSGMSYFPSLMELVVTAAFISIAVLGFKLAAKYFRVFPEAES